MALAKRLPNADGHTKKHDLPTHHDRWQPTPTTGMKSWTAFRRRRVFLVLLALLTVYLFIKYIPTDVPSVAHRTDSLTGQSWARPNPFTGQERSNFKPQKQPAKHDGTAASTTGQLYEGPVKFYKLATSLRPHLYHAEYDKPRVVFALFDLKSTAALVSLACEMAAYNQSEIHIAILAPRDDPLDDIALLSGQDQSQCVVYWHDARPDYNLHSSSVRRKNIAQAQVGHLGATLKPSVFVIDDTQAQHTDFFDAIGEKLEAMQISLLTLPDDPIHSMSWVASVDANALQWLNHVQIDVHINPEPDSSGSLLRLLESIQKANYDGVPIPRITIELPADVEPSALHYIENMRWPPGRNPSASQLVIRRQLSSSSLSPSLAALRTVESFYPPSWPLSHILVLSPYVELSQDYMQFLMYTTLAYKHGRLGSWVSSHLMGIGLDFPASLASGTANGALLLHQKAPSHAAMYFGDKWVELHSWLSHRLHRDKDLTGTVLTSPLSSNGHESWLNEVQMMMQARNHFILYPTFTQSPDTKLMTTHTKAINNQKQYDNERIPEDDKSAETISQILSGSVLNDDDITVRPKAASQMHDQLPLAQLLASRLRSGPPADFNLGLFSVNNEALEWDQAQEFADRFADKVALELGNCPSLDMREPHKMGSVDFLFCDPGRIA